MVAVFELIDFKEIFRLLKSQPRDGAVAAITLGSTLLFAPHLDIGILIGIGASVLAHMHRSATPHMEIFFCHDVDYLHSHNYQLKTYPSNEKVLGVSIHSSLSFANASLIYEKIMNELSSQKKKPKYILLIASSIGEIDSSAEKILLDLHADLKEEKIQLLFAGIRSHVEESLRKTEFYEFVGGANIYPEINLALKAINDRETKHSQ
jgi:SulP family sulfate permease